MRSALARLGSKHRKKDEKASVGPEEMGFSTWHSGGKGDGFAPQLNGATYFSFQELQTATNNFSKSNELGEGGYGKVYKGYLPNGVVVAIKRSKAGPKDLQEFKNEIELLSRVHHKNIASLKGFCLEQGEQMLVYEYITNGDLRQNLDGRTYLDWKKRLEIALDSARGLAYLHELANPQIIHRDVKSPNIMLDDNLNAIFHGFDVSKLNRDKKEGHVSSQVKPTLMRTKSGVAGTLGYLDPEYVRTGLPSDKSDVYSFGMVMLELVTGRGVYGAGEDGESTVLMEKANTAVDQYCDQARKQPLTRVYGGCEDGEPTFLMEKVKKAIDQCDQEYYGVRDLIDSKIVNQARNIGLRKFVQLALACVELPPSDRPSMPLQFDAAVRARHDRRWSWAATECSCEGLETSPADSRREQKKDSDDDGR